MSHSNLEIVFLCVPIEGISKLNTIHFIQAQLLCNWFMNNLTYSHKIDGSHDVTHTQTHIKMFKDKLHIKPSFRGITRSVSVRRLEGDGFDDS